MREKTTDPIRFIKMKAVSWYVSWSFIGRDILKCYAPFLLLLAAFASFRFITPELTEHIHYTLMPAFDKAVFGQLPTIWLQHLLWHGYVTWYDYILYGVYVSHYIFPIFLAWAVYKKRHSEYIRFASTYMLATFAAFCFFIMYPTAPPWLASQDGYIPHVTRIASAIFASVGIHDFARLYSNYAPNPVAAMPSLHTAYSVMFVLFVRRYFGWRWTIVSLLYPFCIILGVVYMGEHYVLDVCGGIALAISSYLIVPVLLRGLVIYAERLGVPFPFAAYLKGDLHE